MEKKKSKIFISIIIVVILIIGLIICYNKFFKNDAEKSNVTTKNQEAKQEENKINELKKIEGYEIFNAQISVTKGITNFKAYIKNTSNTLEKNKEFKIEILNGKEEIIGEMPIHVEEIKPNQIVMITGNLMKGIKDEKDYRIIEI